MSAVNRGPDYKTGLTVPADWGTNWRAKLAASDTGLAKWCVNGTSIDSG